MAVRPRILVPAEKVSRATIACAVAIEPGDLISWESNTATLLNAASDDATFAGYAITQYNTAFSEPDRLVVGLRGVVEYDSTSATYSFGAGVTYTSENAMAADAGYNTLAWSNEYKTSATRLECMIDVVMLRKLFGVDA